MHAAASFYCQQWAAKASTGQPDCAACLSRSGGEKFLGNFCKDSIASDSKARLAGQTFFSCVCISKKKTSYHGLCWFCGSCGHETSKAPGRRSRTRDIITSTWIVKMIPLPGCAYLPRRTPTKLKCRRRSACRCLPGRLPEVWMPWPSSRRRCRKV